MTTEKPISDKRQPAKAKLEGTAGCDQTKRTADCRLAALRVAVRFIAAVCTGACDGVCFTDSLISLADFSGSFGSLGSLQPYHEDRMTQTARIAG